MTNRIHQLNQTILELRLRGLSERQEIRELRQANKELKTQLEATQREIAVLREMEASLIRRWNSSHMLQNQRTAGKVSDQQGRKVEESGTAPAVCFDARQYEELSVARAELKGVGSYFLKTLRPPCSDR